MKPKEYVFRMFQHGKDEDLLHCALSDPRVVRHMATEKITLQDCEQIIDGALNHWATFGYGSWAVVHSQTAMVIGWAGFKNWQEDEVELLCVLTPQCWGLGKSILKDLLDYARHEMKIEKVYILLPHTRKTFRAIQKIGFQSCGPELFNDEPFEKFVFTLS